MLSKTFTAKSNDSRRINLMGMPLDALRESEAVKHIIEAASAHQGGWVITPNLDQMRLFCARPELREMYQQADLVVADGMPLVWASRLQKTPLPERIAGSSLIFSLSAAAAASGLNLFLLGGNPGAADGAAEELRRRYPGISISGTYCPPIGFEKDPNQLRLIQDAVAAARPRIVFVGLGFPKQEKLIGHLRKTLSDVWFLGVGVSFSFASGEVKRAPRWMQKSGLEWMHRLAQEPGRLFSRYILHDLPFAARLFSSAILRRFSSRTKRN